MAFEQPLLLSYKDEKKVSLTLEQTVGRNDARFTIAASDGSVTYCRGRIGSPELNQVAAEVELPQHETDIQVGAFYGDLRSRGLEYGVHFATVRELWLGESGSGEAYGRIAATPSSNGQSAYQQAVMLDGCLQVFGGAISTLEGLNQPGAYVPAAVKSITFTDEFPAQVWSHVRVNPNSNGHGVVVTIEVINETGEVVARFENLELRRTLSMAVGGRNGSNGSRGTSADRIFKARAHALEQLRPISRKERVALLSKWLTAEIKDTMGQAADRLNLESLPPSTAFLEIGLDSLLVTELQRRIQEKMEFRFKPMEGLDYQSIESMAEFILDEVLAVDLPAEVPVAGD
jgi:hypothetical protein